MERPTTAPHRPDRKSHWQSTLESFADSAVVLKLVSGATMTGTLFEIGTYGTRLQTEHGPTYVRYEHLRGCEQAA